MLTTDRVPLGRWMWSLVALGIVPVVLLAQASHGPTSVRRDLHHDVSLPLIDLMRQAPPASRHQHEAEPVRPIPLPRGLTPLPEDPVRQWRTFGYTPLMSTSFEGLGNGRYGFIVEYSPPDGDPKPLVSTLNALDGSITNNMAIVPSTNGKVDAFAAGITQLILDISSYFAP